jgi:hypothetical protein
VIARLTENGSLDSSFGDHGIRSLELSSLNDQIASLQLTENGDLLGAGSIFTEDSIEPIFVRLNEELPDASPWRNALRPADANADGEVTARDALMVINQLARIGENRLPDIRPRESLFVDVNGDWHATALDALVVINELARSKADGESEPVAWPHQVFAKTDELDHVWWLLDQDSHPRFE